jgi:hypothetical protein
MKNLREEMNEALDLFETYGIAEEKQLYIIGNGGVSFNFAHGTDRQGINRKFDPLKFARFLKFCQTSGIIIDADALVYGSSYGEGLMELVHAFDKLDKMSKDKTKSKTR